MIAAMEQPPIRLALAEYLRSVAAWRRSRYEDDLRDRRNLQSAAALEALAGHVESLPADDPRLARLAELALDGVEFVPGQQTAYEIGRFHFHSTEATHDGFLDAILDLAERDRRELGHFGGRQVPGDDPWKPSGRP
jgi:hypothetical protein